MGREKLEQAARYAEEAQLLEDYRFYRDAGNIRQGRRSGLEEADATDGDNFAKGAEFEAFALEMFQPLRTRDEYPGTGIALAIAKKIMECHGGRIWVEGEEGKGSTFQSTIPKRV